LEVQPFQEKLERAGRTAGIAVFEAGGADGGIKDREEKEVQSYKNWVLLLRTARMFQLCTGTYLERRNRYEVLTGGKDSISRIKK
jgi:hypothetical protein